MRLCCHFSKSTSAIAVDISRPALPHSAAIPIEVGFSIPRLVKAGCSVVHSGVRRGGSVAHSRDGLE